MPGGRPENPHTILNPQEQVLTLQDIEHLNIILADLHRNTSSLEDTVYWLTKHGLLANKQTCPECEEPMKIYNCKQSIDLLEWRCRPCKCKKSIRNGSFFENSKLSLDKLITLIYWWTTDAKQDIVIRETGISRVSVIDWFQFIRDICSELVENHSEPIGGFDPIANEPRIVEIDESCFMGRKHNRGNDREHHWVFGGQ